MLRIIGCILVVACSATFGISCAARLGIRVRAISGIIFALEVMKSEICDRLTPMPALMEMLSEQTDAPVNNLFALCEHQMNNLGAKSFYFIWKNAVEASPQMELRTQEAHTLIELGHVLGRYDTQEQASIISSTIRRFEHYLKLAEQERKSQGKLHAALGVAAGFFAVIILI